MKIEEIASEDKRPIIYIWPANENIVQNLINRRQRPVEIYEKIAKKAMKKVWKKVYEIRWSQRAGCECGCSPGFITTGTGREYVDLHVTFTKSDL